LQLQKNAFDQDRLKNSIPTQTDLALFDFDEPDESGRRRNFEEIYKNNSSRMADTKFDDDNEN